MLGIFYSVENFINGTLLGSLQRRFNLHSLSIVRPLVVIGVLLLTGLLAIVAPTPIAFLVFPALLFLAGGVILVWRYPPLGLMVVVLSGLLPFNWTSGLNATPVLLAGLIGLWIIQMLLARNLKLAQSGTFRPLFALLIIASLAFAVGQIPWYTFARPAPMGAQVASLGLFFLSGGGFLLAAHQIRHIKWLEWLTWVFLAIVAVYIFGRILPVTKHLVGRVFNITNTGSLFWVWGAGLAFSQMLYNKKLWWGWRVFFGVLTLAIFYVGYVIQGDWKSGWVPAFVTVATIVALRVGWKPLVALAPLMVFPAWILGKKIIESDAYSYSTRVEAWSLITQITKINPILGLGPANYRWYTPLFPIRGYSVFYFSHNQYVDLFAQTGILGVSAFLWFIGAVGKLGWELRRRVPAGTFAQAYVYAALGGVVGTLTAAMLGDWVIGFFYNVGFTGSRVTLLGWIFLGGLVAIEQMSKPANAGKSGLE